MSDEASPGETWHIDHDTTTQRQASGEPRSTRTLATELVAMAREQYQIVRGTDAQVYAVARTNPGVAIPLRGSRDGLRQQLAAAYFDQRGKAPTAVALADMLNVVEGDALRADAAPVDLRVAARGGALYLDRATPAASAIRVTPTGWDVTGAPPVVFRRTALSAPLPEPTRGSTLVPFRDLLNVDDAGFRLLIGWLLAAYMPGIPHPILALLGQQGTAKTTALRLLLSLLDPSTAPVRTPPTEPAAWAVTAAHSWAVGLDNVSALPARLQDALCKAVTRTLKTPPKKPQAASQPAMTAVRAWEQVNHTNMCRERTAVKISACIRRCFPVSGSVSRAQLGEVELALHARLAVDDADRARADPEPAPLDREPVQRPVRHLDTLAGQQLLDLPDAQCVPAIAAAHPGADLLLVAEQDLPRRAVPVRPRRPDRVDHLPDQLIGDRLHAGVADQAGSLGRSDVPTGRLAVHPRPLGDLPQPVPFQPGSEHLTDLNHADLPESHARRPPRPRT